MAESTTLSETSTNGSSINLRSKLLCKSELKSSIPKPIAMTSRTSLRAKSSSSCQSQPCCVSRIPVPLSKSLDRSKTSLSLQYQPVAKHQTTTVLNQAQKNSLSPTPRVDKEQKRPKTANELRNLSQSGKTKEDNENCKPQLKIQFKPFSFVSGKHPSSKCADKTKETICAEKIKPPEGNKISNEEIVEKQRQILKINNELKKFQSPKDLQPLEKEICRLMQNETLEHIEALSKENISLVPEGSPEFLTAFDKQMQEVSDLWMRFVCDIITNKVIVGSSGLSKISLPDLTQNIRDEVMKLLTHFPNEGETLRSSLQKVEKEMIKAKAVIVHNGMTLSQQYEQLKDSYFRLEKTQDQINFELKEQVAILGEENQELDRKYERAVEMYNKEKIKVEQQEKYKIKINKELVEVKNIFKVMEGRCQEWETKTKKTEATCKALEIAVRNKDITIEKENKHHRELLNKYNESKEKTDTLKSELMESNQSRIHLESENKDLKEELSSKKSILEELEQKSNELSDELALKSKKLNEAENEMNLIRDYISNSASLTFPNPDTSNRNPPDLTTRALAEGLTKELHQKNLQVQELKKKLSVVEHLLKEKETREETLLRQVSEIQKQISHESEVALKAKINDLNYELRAITEEKAELEKIISQKTLELDQRDMILQQHAQVLCAKDELIPMFQDKQRKEKEYIEKLSAIVIEKQKTYFDQGDDKYSNKDEPNLQDMLKTLEKRYFVDPKMVNKELSFRQEKMSELFNLAERKQMEIMRLERRLQKLQGIRVGKEESGNEKQGNLYSLQRELEDRRTGKCRGLFSFFSGKDSC